MILLPETLVKDEDLLVQLRGPAARCEKKSACRFLRSFVQDILLSY